MAASRVFPQHIIARKRDGHALSRDEIGAFVRGATDGTWADYQLSAMLMAIFLRGFSPEETAVCTEAMMRSGAVADLTRVRQPTADKHSTGGVGDKISLHLAPMVAACGVAVPMISGRGLGHTGGTLDKLESIPGFRVNLSLEEYRAQVDAIGLCLIGQSAELAPADRKLYALRDVTATVECIPLICASILSKKLAEGAQALVLDVKFGRGAFMQEPAKARELAEALVAVARTLSTPLRALLTSMDQPLGRAVGHAVEVAESIDCLEGRGPADTMAVTFALGEQMLMLAGRARTAADARTQLEASIATGAARDKFRALVRAQGGDAGVIDDRRRLPAAAVQRPVLSPDEGYVQEVDPLAVSSAVTRLGGSRIRADDKIDHAVGVTGLCKIGERVARGQPLCVIHAQDDPEAGEAETLVRRGIVLAAAAVQPPRLIGELIG